MTEADIKSVFKGDYVIVENPVVGGGTIKGWGVHTKTFVNGKIIAALDDTKELAIERFIKQFQR